MLTRLCAPVLPQTLAVLPLALAGTHFPRALYSREEDSDGGAEGGGLPHPKAAADRAPNDSVCSMVLVPEEGSYFF